MMKFVNDRLAGTIGSEEILWVITVPAIWTDGAKQFMREAAVKASIKTEKLVIALEPEAASVFCRHLSVYTTVGFKEVSLATFPDDTKYIVLDAGGGTIDITVHEVVPDGLKEIKAASGGGWGGTMVDNAFKTFLTDIFGKDIYDKFKQEDTEDWLDLWRDFEAKKRGISHDKTAKISIKIPISLINMFEEIKEQKLSTTIASTKYAENVTFAGGDKLRFSPSVFQNLFKESISLTIDPLKSLMKDISVRAILMVGGYSESPMLQHAVKTTFTDVEVVIPLGASSTILRGALVYGHSPEFIKERILKYTYGIGCSKEFIAGVHDQRKLIQTDRGERCDDLFNKYVEKGQTVSMDERVNDTFYPRNRDQTEIYCSVYASESKNPMYTDEEGCTLIGEITIPLEDHDRDLFRAVKVSQIFSDTENQVEVVDDKSGRKQTATFNFLQ
ncbi:heat shock 70 kDa protein 12A-like [Mercenaria mercenaria]|uniref:heat shock 70 kDa protein 12A-like n=1 Tax=Mercenaria mercenaria TaxID=6596 RepID=UPI00234F3BD3|nr:heat shock 70 kDa protein 12A-like [Mercenaria mercenaria]